MWIIDVRQLRELRHQLVLDDVGGRVRRLQRRRGVEPEVQVEKGVVGRAARPNLLAPEHLGHRLHDRPHVGLRQ